MKIIITLAIFFIANLNVVCQTSELLEYSKEYQFKGKIVKVKYFIPNGDSFETFILELDKPISVNANQNWEKLVDVKELHLNILNTEIEVFEKVEVEVLGTLFHALTLHHIRDVCIKVKKISTTK